MLITKTVLVNSELLSIIENFYVNYKKFLCQLQKVFCQL